MKPSFMAAAKKRAAHALEHKGEYEAISALISRKYGKHIPWWFIPLVHERECIKGVDNWTCNIAQGCKYAVKCHIVPPNGPFNSFEEAAIDALVRQAPRAANWVNWSGGGTMTIAEAYNGTGYARRGKPSPYIFSGTNIYFKGKFTGDHKYDPDFVDTQIGVAVSLKALMELDPSIHLDGDLPGQDQTDRTKEVAHATVGTGGIAETAHQAIINGVDDWIVYTVAVVAAIALGVWIWKIVRNKKAEV